MKRIEKLTDQQRRDLDAFYAERLAAGRGTGPCDREAITPVIHQMYAWIGKPAPAVIYTQSPLHTCVVAALLKDRGQLWDQLWDQLGGQLGDQLWGQLGDQLWGQLGDQLGGQLWSQLGDQLWGQLGGQLWGQLWGQLGDQLWGQLRGQHDSWWCFYLFVTGVVPRSPASEQIAKLQAWSALSGAGWWKPMEGVCIVSDRPEVIELDDDGRLHCESGPAMRFSDGLSVWSVGGVRVNEQIVMRPETQTIDEIIKETNEEVKRVRIERFGWERFIAETDAEVVDTRSNPIENTREMLVRMAGITALVCHCPSTARVYALEVPPKTKTCEEAQNWLWANESTRYPKPRLIGRS